MKFKLPKLNLNAVDTARRKVIGRLLFGGGLLALGGQASRVQAADEETLRFPGETPDHRLVYQLNKADNEYQQHILFSAGAMLRKYGDNIGIVIVAIGPGIHILAKNPQRPVSTEIKQRVSSLNQYGVEFHACGNTMKSLGWTEKDMVPFAKVVEVGAADLMELQEQGYAYISW